MDGSQVKLTFIGRSGSNHGAFYSYRPISSSPMHKHVKGMSYVR